MRKSSACEIMSEGGDSAKGMRSVLEYSTHVDELNKLLSGESRADGAEHQLEGTDHHW